MIDNLNEIKENPNFKSAYIDTLYGIKLNLSIKKIISDKISKKEFKSIIDDAEKSLDKSVKNAIDYFFDEYFESKDRSLSANEMSNIISKEINTKVKTLNDGHFKNKEEN